MENYETGYLRVTVRTASNAIPLSGAMVTVKSISDEGESNIVAIVYTDAGGNTPTVELDAPPKSFSSTPGAGRPYRYYNIDTDKALYYSVRNINVPIYASVTAVQPVQLVPFAESPDTNAYPEDMVVYFESRPPNL